MGDDKGAGVAGERRLDQFARVDGVHRDRAFGHHGRVKDRVGRVEEDHGEHLVLQAAHRVDEVVGHLAGGADVLLAHHPLVEVAAGHPLDEMQGEGVLRADPLDLLQLHRRRVEHRRQAAELGEQGPGRLLAVRAGRAEGEQQLDDLGVGEGLDPLGEELVAQPLAMALATALPLIPLHLSPARSAPG